MSKLRKSPKEFLVLLLWTFNMCQSSVLQTPETAMRHWIEKKGIHLFFFESKVWKRLEIKYFFSTWHTCPIPPSVENFSLPALYPPHYKWFSSLPYSPLCRKVFAIYISIKLTLYTDSFTHYPHLKIIHGFLIISPTIIIDIPPSTFLSSEKFAIIPIHLPVLKILIDTLSSVQIPYLKIYLNPCQYPPAI